MGLQTGSSRWKPDPEHTVDGEAVQSAILLLLRSICDALFSPQFGVVFSQFFTLNALIMPYNIRY